MIPIDPGIEKLFPCGFLESELKKYPNVKAIKANHFYYSLKNAFGYFCPADGVIVLDPSVEPKIIAANTNRNHPELNLTEEEAWPWMFFHEIYHSEKGAGEWDADNYAIKRIGELRKKKEGERKDLVSTVYELVRQGIRKSLG